MCAGGLLTGAKVKGEDGMRAQRRILLLYMSFSPGSGHYQAAQALEKAFGQLYPQVQTMTIDFFVFIPPMLKKAIVKVYFEMVRLTPRVYRYLWQSDRRKKSARIRGVINRLSSERFKEFLQDFGPEAVVCTQAFPCGALSTLKKREKIGIPLVAVGTDFDMHLYWLYEEVDLYVVATDFARAKLLKKGVEQEKIKLIGIPIDPVFNQRKDKLSLKEKMGLDLKMPTLLVMGGSRGLGSTEDIIRSLDDISLPFQVIVVAGINKPLRERLNFLSGELSRPLHVVGYVDNIDEMMEVADLLITKPGGLTSTEALAKGLPLIIIDPLPGQEELNARYLIERGIAMRANNPEEVGKAASNLLTDWTRLGERSLRARKLASADASMDIVRSVMDLVAQSQRAA